MIPFNTAPQYDAPATALVQPWMSTGLVGGFAINAFGPRQMATAKHVGVGVGATVHLNDGSTRHVVSVVCAPNAQDTSVVTVDADLPTWSSVTPVTLVNPTDAMFVSAGLTAGAEVRDSSDQLRGWFWGGTSGKLQWTQSNTKYARQPLDQYEVGFDATPGSFAMTAGDSGGGLYAKDEAGAWHLQGIGVGISAHNGPLQVDGLNVSEFDLGVRPSNSVYQSNDMVMPRSWLTSLVPQGGDTDFNGHVDFRDLVTLARNYDEAGTWTDGDFNGDGVVNFDDMVLLSQNYQDLSTGLSALSTMAGLSSAFDASTFSTTVPEPATIMLCAAPLLRRTRRPI